MSQLEQRFEEDRKLRDTARAVLMDDITHVRANFSPKGVADRTVGRVGDGVKDVYEVGKVHFDDNRGVLAVLIGILLLWLGREPIMEALGMIEDAVEEALDTEIADNENDGDASAQSAPEVPFGDNDEH